jgi:hypothetical protein
MSVFGRLVAVATVLSASACSSAQGAATDGGAERSPSVSGGAGGGAIGDPCAPSVEADPTFSAFDFHDVSVESHNAWCATPVCLVNHFQGRVTCPYGQAADGSPRVGARPECTGRNPITGGSAGCCTPGGAPQAVTGPLTADGGPADAIQLQTVPGQCMTRTADISVYCSCRCANDLGATDDGASYCSCPAGFSCTQLVVSIGASAAGDALSGAYCVKNGTQYDPSRFVCAACDPITARCGTP